MASYTSEIVVVSAIIAVLGVAAYIVAQPRPAPRPKPQPAPMLTDVAGVIQGYSNGLFLVPATPTTKVYQWVKRVKEENKDIIGDVATASLVVYKLNNPIPAQEAQNELPNRWNDLSASCVQMNPIMKMGNYFKNLPEKHVHVIVKSPTRQVTQSQRSPESIPMQHTISKENAVKALHSTLWKKPINLREVQIGQDVFEYLSTEYLVNLKLASMGFKEGYLLVRKEYALALEWMDDCPKGTVSGGVVIIGHPGIGKTCFLFYVLLHRISKGLPTALQTKSYEFYLFTEEGAFVCDSIRSDSVFPPNTWALSDSGVIQKPCEAFLNSHIGKVWVVQATSPDLSRWKEWKKQRHAALYVMDYMPIAELEALGSLRKLDIAQLTSKYRLWGPSARVCIQLAQYSVQARYRQHIDSVTQAARRFINKDILTYVDMALETNEADDILFFVRPESTNKEDRSVARTEIPTEHLRQLVLHEFAVAEASRQSEFFTRISSYKWLRGSAGWLFEKLVHVRLTADPSSTSLEATPVKIGESTLSIPVCNTVLTGESSLNTIHNQDPPVYWRPTSQTFPSIDAVICTSDHIMLIQIIVASTHKVIPDGITQIQEKLSKKLSKDRKWCLVFVTDREETASRLREQAKLKDLDLDLDLGIYSCVYRVDQTPLTKAQKSRLQDPQNESPSDTVQGS